MSDKKTDKDDSLAGVVDETLGGNLDTENKNDDDNSNLSDFNYENEYEEENENEDEDENENEDEDEDGDEDEDEDLPKQGLGGLAKVGLGALVISVLGAGGFVGYHTLLPQSQPTTITDLVDVTAIGVSSNDDDLITYPASKSEVAVIDEPLLETYKSVDQVKVDEDKPNLEYVAMPESFLNTGSSEVEVIGKVVTAIFESDEFNARISENSKTNSLDMIEQVKSEVMDAVRAEMNSLIEIEIKKIPAEKVVIDNSEVNAAMKALNESVADRVNKLVDEKMALKKDADIRLSKSRIDTLKSGRTRLKGFVIINKSIDGSMSVVKTPSGRINVYYKGEKFSNNGKNVVVNSIEDNGHLVLVGREYFIDEIEEKRKVKKRPANKINKDKTTKVKEKEKVISQKEIEKDQIPSRQYRAEMKYGKKVAVGYSLNGESSKGYMVQTRSGQWVIVNVGDNLSPLGKVIGEDLDGNLVVGNHIILDSD